MKTLEDFIKKYNEDYSSLDFEDNYIINDIIVKKYYENLPLFTINESLGLFNGCKSILNYIEKNLLDFCKQEKIIINSSDISSLSDKFFNKLYLTLKKTNSDEHGEYVNGQVDDNKNNDYELVKWNKDKQIFNFIEIRIFYYSENNIRELLTHELIHAYSDYKLHINKSSLRINEINLKNKLNKLNISSKDINETIKSIYYYLNHFEVNAYIGQINSCFKNKKFDNAKSCINYLSKNSSSYINYKTLYQYINSYLFTDFCKENNIDNKIKNDIIKKINNIWKKIINHTYLIACEYIDYSFNKSENILYKLNF